MDLALLFFMGWKLFYKLLSVLLQGILLCEQL
jgi:hypothetical protein